MGLPRVYGLDPDEQSVADAVRASMAIPFFFRPASLTSATGCTSTLVDGGLLSNFPIDSLDRPDGKPPRWPSFGVTVLPNLAEGGGRAIPALARFRLLGPPHLLEGVITTVLVGRDQAYLNLPWVCARAIRVDSTDVGLLGFDISDRPGGGALGEGLAADDGSLPPGTGRPTASLPLMELLGIVPLPVAMQAAAFATVAGEVALVRAVRTLLGGVPTSGVVIAAGEPLVVAARSCLDSVGLSAIAVLTAAAPGTGVSVWPPQPKTWRRTASGHARADPRCRASAGHDRSDRTRDRRTACRAPRRRTGPARDRHVQGRERRWGRDGHGRSDRIANRPVSPRLRRATLRELIVGDADEFAAALSAGLSIATVDGDPDGFAAELPADAELMDAISAAHHPA